MCPSLLIYPTGTPSIDYDSYLTARSKARKPSAIRALMPLLSIPGNRRFGALLCGASLCVGLAARAFQRLPCTHRIVLFVCGHCAGMISLGGGLPNEALFPFQEVTLKLKSGEAIDIKGAELKCVWV